jgi:hypothetical protein
MDPVASVLTLAQLDAALVAVGIPLNEQPH